MADYNVNMKQWNGTSFDSVLPLAYNAKQLGGQSLAEVKQWVQDNGLMLYTGQYLGTGMYGVSNPTVFTFPFEPIILFMPVVIGGGTVPLFTPMICNNLTSSYQSAGGGFDTSSGVYPDVFMKISDDRKTISWYVTGNNVGPIQQANNSGRNYTFAAIGGYDMGGKIPVGATFTITFSESWRVPATGRYMLELYGMGGRGYFGGANEGAQGGASCQHYDSIALTKGDFQQIIIGDSTNTATKFGTYSVENAGNGALNQGGVGTGNRGKSGIWSSIGGALDKVYGNGELSSTYGWGGTQNNTTGGPGAVYLKYLGE